MVPSLGLRNGDLGYHESSAKWAKMCPITIGNQTYSALVDTGADATLISKHAFDKISSQFKTSLNTQQLPNLTSASGHKLPVYGTSKIKIKFGSRVLPYRFIIVKIQKPLILGSDFLSCFNFKWDFQQQTLSLNNIVVQLQDKRDVTDVGLVRVSTRTYIPPSRSVLVNCIIPKHIKGDCVVTPLDNSSLFIDQPGLMSPNLLVSVGPSHQQKIWIKNDTQRAFTVNKNIVVATIEQLPVDQEVNEVKLNNSSSNAKPEQFKSTVTLNDIKADFSKFSKSDKAAFTAMLKNNLDVFASSDLELGKTNVTKMTIDTGEHAPIKQRPYKIPYAQREQIEKQIGDMLTNNIVRPSTSPWSSPLVIVPKKDGTKRMCVDFRKINNVTVKNSYPLPDITDILSSLKDAKIFSSLDLRSGYWQIEMEEKDKGKTAFICHMGLFEFNVMPFGLCDAPPVFQELMNKVLGKALNKFAFAYLDDIIIYSSSIEEHMKHLQYVFDRLRDANLRCKPSKCDFARTEISFLGHVISERGISPDPQKVEVIKNLLPPQTVKEVRSFVGMASYYRKFIPNFSGVASPLTDLTRKRASFQWTDVCQKAFETLKYALSSAPLLAHPDLKQPFHLYTDASQYAIGAVLTQTFPEGERVIQYLSKRLSDGQMKWATIEREAFAIVFSINKLRPYLLGSKFTVYTDHKPLRSLFTSEMKNARIQRWAIILSEYGCDIKYKTGKTNIPADMLSRITNVNPDDEIIVLDSTERKSLSATIPHNIDEEPEDTDVNPLDKLLANKPLRNWQREDDLISQIINDIETGGSYKDFVLEDDLLYHITAPVATDVHVRLQLVIPAALTRGVLLELHDSEYGGGHVGLDKTYDKIRRRYYWPNMYKDTMKFVEKCALCRARRQKRDHAPMQDMPIPNYPFEIVGIDTCGPYPETEAGNKYVMTVVDHLTGWPEAFATRDKTANTVANVLLRHILPRHACPKILLSDRGSEFLNGVIEYLTEKLHVIHLKTSPYHPQTNAKTERFHRFMVDALSKYSYSDPNNWDTFLPPMLMAYRTAIQKSSKFSPFFMMYGRDPILPIDTLLQPKLKYLGEEHVANTLQQLHQAYLDAQENLKDAREYNRRRIDRNAVLKQFEPGDAVFYYNPNQMPGESSKLRLKWSPFYRILEQTSPVNYKIKHQLSGLTKIVHVNHLKHSNPDACWDKIWTQHGDLQPSKGKDDEPLVERRRQPVRAVRVTAPLRRHQGQENVVPREATKRKSSVEFENSHNEKRPKITMTLRRKADSDDWEALAPKRPRESLEPMHD